MILLIFTFLFYILTIDKLIVFYGSEEVICSKNIENILTEENNFQECYYLINRSYADKFNYEDNKIYLKNTSDFWGLNYHYLQLTALYIDLSFINYLYEFSYGKNEKIKGLIFVIKFYDK